MPAFAADRGIIDLLAVDRTGRLAVIELKASADIHLPLQALDYWMRVNLHLTRETFGDCGYFPGVALRKAPRALCWWRPRLNFTPAPKAFWGISHRRSKLSASASASIGGGSWMSCHVPVARRPPARLTEFIAPA
ncbi:MAG: hypothetical protein DMG58_02495 [Acidobacteria bacterium]|nr:MAG: hypothetical protein DMG58_02495 [Acidobacteriota bacterium]